MIANNDRPQTIFLNLNPETNALTAKLPRDFVVDNDWEFNVEDMTISDLFFMADERDWVRLETNIFGWTPEDWEDASDETYYAVPGRYHTIQKYFQSLKRSLESKDNPHPANKFLKIELKTPRTLEITAIRSGFRLTFSAKAVRHLFDGLTGLPPPSSVIENESVKYYFDPNKGFRKLFAVCNLAPVSVFRDRAMRVVSSSEPPLTHNFLPDPADRYQSGAITFSDSGWLPVCANQLSDVSVKVIDEFGDEVKLHPFIGTARMNFRKRDKSAPPNPTRSL